MGKVLRFFLAAALLLSCFVSLFSQTSYDEWKKNQEKAFQQYLSEEDAAFMKYLEDEWSAFQAYKGIPFDKVPKIDEAPVTFFRKEKPSVSVSTVPAAVPDPPVERSAPGEMEGDGSGDYSLKVPFYNMTLGFGYESSIYVKINGRLRNSSIADFWKDISQSEYQEFLDTALFYRENMKLNDWGFLIMVNNLAKELFSLSAERDLFIWFMLNKAGYNVKVGYSGNFVYLLLASDNVFYETPYFIINGKKFFLVSINGDTGPLNSIYTYSGTYPDAERTISLNLSEMPSMGSEITSKRFSFNYGAEEFYVDLDFNRNLIDYFEYYPHTDSSVYFDVSFSGVTYDSIVSGLYPIIKDRSEAEAANILLRFVQTSFEYATDQEQFGREKWLFPEEILFYPYCDCEDRSVFYAKLVDSLLRLDVVGIDWPGHIGTGVNFTEDLPGDYFNYRGRKYLICDPTYINADIGMCMPELKGVSMEIIDIN